VRSGQRFREAIGVTSSVRALLRSTRAWVPHNPGAPDDEIQGAPVQELGRPVEDFCPSLVERSCPSLGS